MSTLLRRGRVVVLALLVLAIAGALGLNAAHRRRKLAQPRVLLIGAYGNGNFGDDIIGQAIVANADGIAADFTIAARQTDISRLQRDVAPTVVVGEGIRSLVRTWRLANGTDVAVLGGGGLLEGKRDDVNVHRLILEYLGKLGVSGLRGNRIVVHGIGVSPTLYSSRLVNWATAALLRRVDQIAVRDPRSQRAIASLGTTANLVRDPATALFATWAAAVDVQPKSIGVVVLDRHRWPSFRVSSATAEGRRANDLTEIRERLLGSVQPGGRIRIFTFHWSDVAFAEDLRASILGLGAHGFAVDVAPYDRTRSAEPFLELMACERVFTMRFHPALAALTAGRTVAIMGTLQKLEDLRSTTSTSGQWTYPASYGDPVPELCRALTLDSGS